MGSQSWGSLGLVLPFGGSWLQGPFERAQLAVESVLAGLEPLLHQLLELPQLLVQLGLDVGAEGADLAYGVGKRGEVRNSTGQEGSPLAEHMCTYVHTQSPR